MFKRRAPHGASGDPMAPTAFVSLLAALAASLAMTGCVDHHDGPLRVEGWALAVHDTHNVTFTFTVRNAGGTDVLIIESHLGARQFDRNPDGALRYGEFGHVVSYPASGAQGGALFNDSEVLKPGESRAFSLPARYPFPQSDISPGETYLGYLVLDYVARNHFWRTAHASPCLRADGTEGPGLGCHHLVEYASPHEAAAT